MPDKHFAALSRTGGKDQANVHHFLCDVSKKEQIVKVSKDIHDKLGVPSLVVNCAGINKDSLLLKLKEDEVQEV